MKWATPASAGGLEARAGQDVRGDRDRSRAGQAGGDDARPVGQLGALEHRGDGSRTGPRDRTAAEADAAPAASALHRPVTRMVGAGRRARLRRSARRPRRVGAARSDEAANGRGGTHARHAAQLLSLRRRAPLVVGAVQHAAPASAARRRAPAAASAGTGTPRRRRRQIPEIEEGKFNVAMVLIGPHDDGGWSQAHYEGLQYVCENVENTHVAYIENVPEGADSEQTFRSLARKGFDFIIGTSFGYMDPMETVAGEFPDTTFLHLTGYKSNGTNFGNFFGAMEDFKYLAGMLAGSRARPTATRRSATWPRSRSPRSSASATRSCAGSR